MRKKVLISISLLALILISGVALADGRFKKIDVFFERINVTMNGQTLPLSKDSLFYNGNIYIPLRNLTEMLGAEASWSSATRSVNLDFVVDKRDLLLKASQKGMYQYMVMENNRIMESLIARFEKNDMNGMKQELADYEKLHDIAEGMKNEPLANIYDKLIAAGELLRSGYAAKNMDDYYIAWTLFSENADKLNKQLIGLIK